MRLRIKPPIRYVAEALVESSAFKSDLNRLVELPNDQWNKLCKKIQEHPGFLNSDALKMATTEILSEVELASSCATTISRLSEIIRDSDDAKAASVVETAVSEGMELNNDAKTRLQSLVELCTTAPSISRQHKATRLANATGDEFESVHFVCDVRPVFDDDRSKIEGAIPVCVLHLAFGDAMNPETVDIRLNSSDLKNFTEEVEAANRKMALIVEMLEARKIETTTIGED